MRDLPGLKTLTYTLLLAASPLAMTSAMAQDLGSTWLDTITVTGTKTEHRVIDRMSASSVVTREQLEETVQPSAVEDVLDQIPGVHVTTSDDEPGAGVSMRGLQEFGRVNVMIDGARQNFTKLGHFTPNPVYLEPELLKQVEVTRGPGAMIHGSGAVGGVANFETIDASDILLPGAMVTMQLKGSYSTNDKAKLGNLIVAAQPMAGMELLGSVIYRDEDNFKDGDGNEVISSALELKNGLFKVGLEPAKGHKIKLSALLNRYEYESGDPTSSPANRNVAPLRENELENDTYTLKYHWKSNETRLIDLDFSGYRTTTEVKQLNISPLQPDLGNTRSFGVKTHGFDLNNTSRFDTGSVGHAFTLGGDFFRDETDSKSDSTNTEFFPVAERDVWGVFAQDEVNFGPIDVTAAVRYDSYELTNESGIENSGTHVSPKLTVGLAVSDMVRIYGTYAQAYRSPSITEALLDWEHPVFYKFYPNPDLDPETASNFEVGANFKSTKGVFTNSDLFRMKVNLFQNEVEDYIDQVSFITFLPPGVSPQFPMGRRGELQYRNLNKVQLRGIELEATYDAGWIFAGLAYDHTRARDMVTGNTDLFSIYPDKAVTTLGFRMLDNNSLTLGGRWFHYSEKTNQDSSVAAEELDLLNLFATYEYNQHFSVGAKADNVFDVSYTEYPNNLGGNPAMGRNVKLWAKVKF